MLAIGSTTNPGSKPLNMVRLAILAGSVAGFVHAHDALAQASGVRDTTTAYGARLNGKAEPAYVNEARINNRLRTRIDSRLSLRVERYRLDNVKDPTAAFAVAADDNSRLAPAALAAPHRAKSQ